MCTFLRYRPIYPIQFKFRLYRIPSSIFFSNIISWLHVFVTLYSLKNTKILCNSVTILWLKSIITFSIRFIVVQVFLSCLIFNSSWNSMRPNSTRYAVYVRTLNTQRRKKKNAIQKAAIHQGVVLRVFNYSLTHDEPHIHPKFICIPCKGKSGRIVEPGKFCSILSVVFAL